MATLTPNVVGPEYIVMRRMFSQQREPLEIQRYDNIWKAVQVALEFIRDNREAAPASQVMVLIAPNHVILALDAVDYSEGMQTDG